MSENILWKPSGYYAEQSNVAQFISEYGYGGYADLVPDTEEDLARIWGDFADDAGIVWRDEPTEVVDTTDGPEFAHWYPGGRLNAVETILDRWAESTPDRPMYIWEDELGDRDMVTYAEMATRTDRLANALRDQGVGRDDVVGLTFPMHPAGFAAALACLRIGAAFTMVFPGYGADAIGHRFDDVGAEIVMMADGYRRGGDVTNLLAKVDEALEYAPGVTDVVVYERLGVEGTVDSAAVHDWEQFTEGYDDDAETSVMDSDDTAFIAYSSGTTGTPKGTIHTHASLLAMGNKEAKYHFDLSEGDTLLWITDYGWIIVPIWMLAGGPALGATKVLLEGSPTHPEDRVWRAIEDYGVTTFGISPTGARTLAQLEDKPRESHDLSSLRILGSTGEPWDEETWKWYLGAVGGDEAPIINASGGTELAGAILSPTPKTPLKPGTLYGPAPGVAANTYDENGDPAEEGYLVIEHPIPGMTHSLTDGDERYLQEYWSDFEGVWNQNDWAERDEGDFWFITGRADDTMNIAGRRVTAPEIEEVISGHGAVNEATVVPVPDDTKGQVPVAFVTLTADSDPERLADEVKALVAEELGKPFRPARVHIVPGLPRTQTGKIPRDVIESAYLGNPVGNVSTLDQAEVLEEFPSRD